MEDLVTTLTLPIPISSRSTASLIANGVSLAGISIPALPAVSLDSLGLLRPLPAALRGLLALLAALCGLLALPCSAVSLGLADLVCGPGMLSAWNALASLCSQPEMNIHVAWKMGRK